MLCRGSSGESEWRKYSRKDVLTGDRPHSEQVTIPSCEPLQSLLGVDLLSCERSHRRVTQKVEICALTRVYLHACQLTIWL